MTMFHVELKDEELKKSIDVRKNHGVTHKAIYLAGLRYFERMK